MRSLLLIVFATGCSAPPEPVEVVTPRTVITRPAEIDSSYLSITISKDGFKAKIYNKTVESKNGAEVDKFIQTNKSLIDRSKIIIHADQNTHHEQFRTIVDVLKKHEYFKFSMRTDPE